ncbi:MAG TPA: hypothetical protein VGN75_01235 [Kaistia sp.]|jgi:predicted DNA-binding transcriptional regulator AlpA|nr:hypothetical protein [Kaistia sp.]
MSTARLLTTAQVADKLGLTVERWYRKRKELEAAGFPRPKAPFGNRWSEPAVDAWIAQADAPPPGDAAAGALPDDDDIHGWQERLRAALPAA